MADPHTSFLLPYEKRMLQRKVVVKERDSSFLETNSDFGCIPSKRSISDLIETGIINVNKPKGPTSHQVSEFVKRILPVKKAGQSGTLDPAVTGVLPVGVGRSTRALQALLSAGKEYVCLMHIHKPQSEKKIMKLMKEFTGTLRQLPPIKSAVKRQWRYRKVYYIDVLEIAANKQDVLFRVGCEAGTYIRKLCDDMGKHLGCGAHMAQLLRTKVGVFRDSDMQTLQDLEDYYSLYGDDDVSETVKEFAETKLRDIIVPMEKAVEHLPKVWIYDSVVPFMIHGSDLALPGVAKFNTDIEPDEVVAVMTLKNELVALGRSQMATKHIREGEKGIVVKTEKVFMKEGVYPAVKKEVAR